VGEWGASLLHPKVIEKIQAVHKTWNYTYVYPPPAKIILPDVEPPPKPEYEVQGYSVENAFAGAKPQMGVDWASEEAGSFSAADVNCLEKLLKDKILEATWEGLTNLGIPKDLYAAPTLDYQAWQKHAYGKLYSSGLSQNTHREYLRGRENIVFLTHQYVLERDGVFISRIEYHTSDGWSNIDRKRLYLAQAVDRWAIRLTADECDRRDAWIMYETASADGHTRGNYDLRLTFYADSSYQGPAKAAHEKPQLDPTDRQLVWPPSGRVVDKER
jgi:hypothetical protein